MKTSAFRVLRAPLPKVCLPLGIALLLAGCPDNRRGGPTEPLPLPSVTLSSPAANAALTTDSVTVEGTATGSEPITRLAYVLNGQPEQSVAIQSGTSVQFRFTAPLQVGANTLEVHAYTASNRKGSRSVGFTADACIPTLSAATAAPMSELVVRGVPARFAELRGVLRAPGAGGEAVVLPVRRGSEEVVLTVPLHPQSPKDGGDAELVLSDASSACRALPLRIGALPATPGATNAVVGEMNQVINSLATGFGVERAALLGNPAALAPELRPLAIALQRIEGPNNPNSLRAVLEGTAPLLRGAPLDRELLDAVLAQSGLNAALQSFRQQLVALGPPPAAQAAVRSTAVATRAGAAPAAAAAALTPEQLNYWMQVQQLAAGLVLPEQQVHVAYLALAAQMLGQQAYAAMGVAAAAALQHDALLGLKVGLTQLLPSQLVPMTLHVGQTTLNVGASTDWHARLSARGQPWSIFVPAHMAGQFQHMGALGAVLNQLMQSVSLTPEQQAALVGLAAHLQSSLQASLGSLTCAEQVCVVAGQAVVYGPVDVTAEGRSAVVFTQPSALRLAQGQRNRIEALAATPPEQPVRMQVSTLPGWFNGQTANDERAITVQAGPPVPVGFFADSLSAGADHACALDSIGRAYCWGQGFNGQLGNGTLSGSDRPVLIGGHTFRSIRAGFQHTCALNAIGRAFCWGRNDAGQAGHANSPGAGENTVLPRLVDVPTGMTFRSISAGFQHSCALTSSGEAYCWGSNARGQLGDGSTESSFRPVRVEAGGRAFRVISAGSTHTCAATEDGEAFCWGQNANGELGNGSTTPSLVPTRVSGNARFASLSAGGAYTCGLTPDGAAFCWGGNNAGGRLGYPGGVGQPEQTWVPRPVQGEHAFRSISARSSHTCGVATDGKMRCWGEGIQGQLGNGSTTPSSAPVLVAGGEIQFGTFGTGVNHTCGIAVPSKQVFCWGHNASRQLGDGTTVPRRLTPTPVAAAQ